MRLISYSTLGAPAVGVVVEDRIVDVTSWVEELEPSREALVHQLHTGHSLSSSGMLRLLQGGSDALDRLKQYVSSRGADDSSPLSGTALYAPVPRPGKIVAVGRNYSEHAKETGTEVADRPRIIGKFPSAVIGHGSTINIESDVCKMDYEIELGVVIGGYGRHLAESSCTEIIAGYTILNDITAREFQFDMSPPQATFAKSFDGYAPMGPWLVTADEVKNPHNLELKCYLNGERVQSGNTRDMIFTIPQLISYISRYCSLEPGDIVATGTPAGSGMFRDPPRHLAPSDNLRLEISEIGLLENVVV